MSKLNVNISVASDMEDGYDAALVVSEVIGHSLKENGVFTVLDMTVENVTASDEYDES